MTNFLTLLEGLLAKSVERATLLKEDEVDRIVIYCIAWAIGGLFQDSHRVKVSASLCSGNAGYVRDYDGEYDE